MPNIGSQGKKWPRPGGEAGLTMVETLLSAGVMCALAVILVNMLSSGSRGQKALQGQDDSRTVTSDVANTLGNADACRNTFGGRNPEAGFTVDTIRDAANAAKYEKNSVYGNRTIKLLSVTVGGAGIDDKTRIARWTPSPPVSGTALVLLDWQVSGASGPSNLVRYFLVNMTIDASTRLITSCAAQSSGGGGGSGALPSHAVMAFNLPTCPPGWTEYTPAYGRFIRGIDKSGSAVDPDGERAPGTLQNQGTAVNGLRITTTFLGYSGNPGWGYGVNNVSYTDYLATITSTDPETRPKNTALLYCESP